MTGITKTTTPGSVYQHLSVGQNMHENISALLAQIEAATQRVDNASKKVSSIRAQMNAHVSGLANNSDVTGKVNIDEIMSKPPASELTPDLKSALKKDLQAYNKNQGKLKDLLEDLAKAIKDGKPQSAIDAIKEKIEDCETKQEDLFRKIGTTLFGPTFDSSQMTALGFSLPKKNVLVDKKLEKLEAQLKEALEDLNRAVEDLKNKASNLDSLMKNYDNAKKKTGKDDDDSTYDSDDFYDDITKKKNKDPQKKEKTTEALDKMLMAQARMKAYEAMKKEGVPGAAENYEKAKQEFEDAKSEFSDRLQDFGFTPDEINDVMEQFDKHF